jgi:hypothetical protein
MTLKVHTIESAPEASKPLERSQKHTEWFRIARCISERQIF